MSVQRPDPEHDAAEEATGRLIDAVPAPDTGAAAEPSPLPVLAPLG